jgi:hypothetical protein
MPVFFTFIKLFVQSQKMRRPAEFHVVIHNEFFSIPMATKWPTDRPAQWATKNWFRSPRSMKIFQPEEPMTPPTGI